MNRLLALIAFLALAAFVLVLVIEVPSLDLIVVATLTIAMVAYDFVTSSGKPRG